jgi:hypothetical protein
MNDIPAEIRLRYIKRPFFCPYCESGQIAVLTPIESEHDFATQVMMCVDCDSTWLDVYELSRVEPYELPTPKQEPF